MLRPRTQAAIAGLVRAGIHVVIVTGRMFQSVRPYALEAGHRRSGRLLPGRRRRRAGQRTWLRHVPIPLELARETIAAVNDEGFGLNCYVDDELYVAEITPKHAGTRTSSISSCMRSAICSSGSTGRRRSSS